MHKVVSFGETMIRFSTTRMERLEQAQFLEIRSAGAESNFCIGCSQMGLKPVWISKIPDNPLGRLTQRNLHKYGVETSIVWDNQHRIGSYYIEYGSFPRATSVLYDRDDSAIRFIEEEEIDWSVLDDAEMVHLTGITVALGKKAKKAIEAFIEKAHERGIKVSFDVNYRAKLWSPEEAKEHISDVLKNKVDFLFVGIGDANRIFGFEGDSDKIIEQLKDTFDCELVILTLGSEGAMAYDGEKKYFAKTQPSDTVDPIGSGDAFDAAFVSSYLKGKGIQECLETGNALAALKRTIVGDEPIFSYEDVLKLAELNTKGIER